MQVQISIHLNDESHSFKILNALRPHYFRFQHNLAVVAFTIPAHTQPVKSIAVLKLPEGPKLLSGSTDSTVKVSDRGLYSQH